MEKTEKEKKYTMMKMINRYNEGIQSKLYGPKLGGD
jgi:hypothetical protein